MTKFGLEPTESQYLAALWRQILRDVNITANTTAESLIGKLLKLRTTTDAGLRRTIVAIDQEILALDTTIAAAELEINTLVYSFYDLTPQEIALVERA